MKKLLGIVVLGLLWCNVGFAECTEGDCNNGYGTDAYPDGTKYVGGWKDGKYHGLGTETLNGAKYVGEWKNDKFHGQGTFTFDDGTKYVGGWKDGKYHGLGTFTGVDEKFGSKYVGEWKDGKHHGQGTFTWTTGDFAGDKYVGEWKDGEYHGQGTDFMDGRVERGIWENGKLVNPN